MTHFEENEVTRELDTLASLARQPMVVVTPDTTIAAVRRTFVEHRAAAILVVDGDDNLLGILTRTDALSGIVFVLPMFASVERAAALMAYEGVGQIVLTGDEGELVGVVSAIDIVRHYAVEAGYLLPD